MENSGLVFDLSTFKLVMDEAPTQENGWTLEYEGSANKNFSSKLHILQFLS